MKSKLLFFIVLLNIQITTSRAIDADARFNSKVLDYLIREQAKNHAIQEYLLSTIRIISLATALPIIWHYVALPLYQKWASQNPTTSTPPPQALPPHQTEMTSQELALLYFNNVPELKNIIDGIKNYRQAQRFNIKATKNIILHGPPGTGKTSTATAIAQELGVPCLTLSLSEVESPYHGGALINIHNTFEVARTQASDYLQAHPTHRQQIGAVLVIDEIDSFLVKRGELRTVDYHTAQVTNELLLQFENSANDSILIIGTTNNYNNLDQAAIRAGRFDAKIEIGYPNEAARLAIIQYYAKKHKAYPTSAQDKKTYETVLKQLAAKTEHFNCAELQTLFTKAGLQAVNSNATYIHPSHLFSSFDKLKIEIQQRIQPASNS